jgi:hypothetical protein
MPMIVSTAWSGSQDSTKIGNFTSRLTRGGKGQVRPSLVIQGAKALTVSNRRTVGRGYPKGRECPLVMGDERAERVHGELEGSPDMAMQRRDVALAPPTPAA